ncbi:MAG: transcription antitermination factor NusB [Planctomycetales bacterium]
MSEDARTRRQPAVGARGVALAVLDEHRRTGQFVAPLLDAQASAAELSPADRRFALELVNGIVRRRSTLDALLQPHVRRPRREVEDRLWTILQLGAYQLALLDSVPAHAAVHETVELARTAGEPRWAGFVNGVLRAVARTVTAEFTDRPAADAVPMTVGRIAEPSAVGQAFQPAGDSPAESARADMDVRPTEAEGTGDPSHGRYRRLTLPVFPDPAADPAGHFARAFSFPPWLVRRWTARYPFEKLLTLGFRFDSPPPIVLRVNRLRTSRDKFLDALRNAGIDAEPGAHEAAVRLTGPARIDALPGYAEGQFSVQDESAMAVCDLLDPRPGETVLDLCAAPGTKTTYLAELMDDAGAIVATDVGPERLALVEENVHRLRLASITTRTIERDGRDIPAGPFDAVLLDAPCSNTGVLGRRPEARWRLKPEDLRELPALQARLLGDALARLKPGGRAVYSTCSIEPEENDEVVRNVLAERPEFELVAEHHPFPGDPADGGYRALLRACESA